MDRRTEAEKGQVTAVLWLKVLIFQTLCPGKPTVGHRMILESKLIMVWKHAFSEHGGHRTGPNAKLRISCLPLPSLSPHCYEDQRPNYGAAVKPKQGAPLVSRSTALVGSTLHTLWHVAACLIPTFQCQRQTHPPSEL